MKRVIILACFAALALGRQSGVSPKHGEFTLISERQSTDGKVTHLSGHVTIETDAMILRADAADFDEVSNEIHATGNVTVKLK